MAQVVERAKTFWFLMTQNGVQYMDNGKSKMRYVDEAKVKEEVKRIEIQQTRDIGKMEREVENSNAIPKDSFVSKGVVNEKQAGQVAQKVKEEKEKRKQESQRQIGD